MSLTEVPVGVVPIERFREVVSDYGRVETGTERALELLHGRTVWQINSTAAGGGVAELLKALGPYARSVGVDFRWIVIEGDEEFFTITKRIHNHLHGSKGDGGPLSPAEHAHYEEVLAANDVELAKLIRPDDVVMLHDPQTAGLIEMVKAEGSKAIWRLHIGVDQPTAIARSAWEFLRPYVEGADAYIFSRKAFIWEWLDSDRAWVIPPSIDAFSPKNQDLGPATVDAILAQIGLAVDGGAIPMFTRPDGTPGRVDRRAGIDQSEPLLPGAPVIAQVSRWDRLKDHAGVLEAFARHVKNRDAHLVLVGPAVAGVADDPEGADVLAEVRAARERLPEEVMDRVHLVCLPMDDPEENAAMVNAIQRRATIVTQKSIAEGFGLTVGEAMWKGRPVIGTRIGGIQEQIVDRESGLLLDDPHDLAGFGALIDELLGDPDLAARLGEGARERVREQFLGARHLLQYVEVLGAVLGGPVRE